MPDPPVTEKPYGSWPSPITSARVVAGARRLSLPRLDGERVAWLEGRPEEGGRQVVMAAVPGQAPEELSPADVNVRSRVHEYGGGDYLLRDGRLYYVDFASQRLFGPEGAISEPGPRHADMALSPDGRWLVAVEERPRDGAEPENRIVALPAAGGSPQVVASGHDFVSSPRFSPDGSRLAFTAWSHPDMPWDASALYVVAWGRDGPSGDPRRVAGGAGESVQTPRFAPDGRLTFVSDRSGWWNLHQERDGGVHALCPMEAEFGRPEWVFGLCGYDFVDDATILCRYGRGGVDRLARLDVASGRLDDLALPYEWFDGVQVADGRAVFLAGSPVRAPEVVCLDLADDSTRTLRHSGPADLDPAVFSRPQPIEFASADGRTAHAFYYPPSNPGVRAPESERPPLLVKSHGGPTGAAHPVLDLRIQYWTSRGFAVVDVNYAGSTGYGRAYRERLRGQWGVADVEDCVAAARDLAGRGWVDGERMAISGGSAGGFTTLCALTFHDVFGAGASHYGIGDLEALARDTHKFESRYLDGLVAPYPEGKAVYEARSPLRATERLSCPVIFFQGLEDEVVPPNQAEAMVAALASRGIPHAYVPFEGEQHGFRRAENIVTALDGELFFYASVFGFEVDVAPEAVRIVG